MAFTSDTVLVYHSIGRVRRNAPEYNGFVTRERFSAQMRHLAEHRRVVPLEQFVDAADRPGGRVAITFDDGYRSALEHAVPVLRELGLPATFFVPTKWIGAARGWRTRGAAALELMSTDELVELDRLGFPVESHGASHIDYSDSSTDDIAADLDAAVESLTTLLGRRPRFHAYPYGRTGPESAALVERAGFRAAFVLDRPQLVTGAFALARVPVVPADVRPLFALKSAGRYASLRHSAAVRHAYRAVRPLVRNRWLWP